MGLFNNLMSKIFGHGLGREMSPDSPQRVVTTEEENKMREFLEDSFPSLANAPVAFTRICFYCDTKDGDFWIAPDRDRPGLTIAAGDCGHVVHAEPLIRDLRRVLKLNLRKTILFCPVCARHQSGIRRDQ